MKKVINVFKQSNMVAGYLYFYIHLITEILSFYVMGNLIGDSIFLWVAPFVYDSFAFVPQALIGKISDKYPKINFGIIGTILLIIGLLTYSYKLLPGMYLAIVVLCIGNACIHVAGAEVTLRSSNGKLSHSAIFVGGGSFGVVLGKILSKTSVSPIVISLLGITMIPFILLAECYRRDSEKQKKPCKNFNYHNTSMNPALVILLVTFVVMVRGYMGYGIPTSWNKTAIQTVALFFAMGIGKSLGGILSDAFGMRKTAIASIIGSLPFLIIGDKLMYVSLLGVMLFSMTMSITLALLVSVLKENPGLAFGHTTIGLTLGTYPIFFFRLNTVLANVIVISILALVCLIISLKVIRKDDQFE